MPKTVAAGGGPSPGRTKRSAARRPRADAVTSYATMLRRDLAPMLARSRRGSGSAAAAPSARRAAARAACARRAPARAARGPAATAPRRPDRGWCARASSRRARRAPRTSVAPEGAQRHRLAGAQRVRAAPALAASSSTIDSPLPDGSGATIQRSPSALVEDRRRCRRSPPAGGAHGCPPSASGAACAATGRDPTPRTGAPPGRRRRRRPACRARPATSRTGSSAARPPGRADRRADAGAVATPRGPRHPEARAADHRETEEVAPPEPSRPSHRDSTYRPVSSAVNAGSVGLTRARSRHTIWAVFALRVNLHDLARRRPRGWECGGARDAGVRSVEHRRAAGGAAGGESGRGGDRRRASPGRRPRWPATRPRSAPPGRRSPPSARARRTTAAPASPARPTGAAPSTSSTD